ncbi:MAG: hypothetical protein JST54_23650 [Deltaproteobacteria bacterium]|nr:hypothetical protein [Deltaproteobacteria bacterium]
MTQLWRRHTSEIEQVRRPGLRLLPAMLVGVGIAGLVAYFGLGLRPAANIAVPEVEIRVEGESLRLPDGTSCAVAKRGCESALAHLPRTQRIRVVAPPEALFALAAPVLTMAARDHREATLEAGTGPVPVEPVLPDDMKGWADLNPDAPGVRLRVIIKNDGIWIGSVAGKVLGADPRGPSLVPTPAGQDYAGLAQKLRSVRTNIQDTEDACGLLPALDTPVGDVVQAVDAIHGTFKHVLLAVPK